MLLAVAIIIAAVVMALGRNPSTYEQEPAVPVAIDSLIEEVHATECHDSVTAVPTRKLTRRKTSPTPARNPLDNPF